MTNYLLFPRQWSGSFLISFTDSLNSASGHRELLWCPRKKIHPPLSGRRVVMVTVEHFIQRGNKEKSDTRRGGEVEPEGKCLLDRHHKSIIHSLLFKHSLSSASLSSLFFALTVFLSLRFLSHEKVFLWLQYFNSICYFRKKKENRKWSLSFVLVDGGPSVRALWLFARQR